MNAAPSIGLSGATLIYDSKNLGRFIPHRIEVRAGRTLEGQLDQPPTTGTAGCAFWQLWSPTITQPQQHQPVLLLTDQERTEIWAAVPLLGLVSL